MKLSKDILCVVAGGLLAVAIFVPVIIYSNTYDLEETAVIRVYTKGSDKEAVDDGVGTYLLIGSKMLSAAAYSSSKQKFYKEVEITKTFKDGRPSEKYTTKKTISLNEYIELKEAGK